MTGQLSILAPTRYPWTFNGPRASRHRIERRPFVPLNRIDARREGVTAFSPWPPRRFDLLHAFNRIPLGRTPFIIGFESHLPRGFGIEGGAWWRWMHGMLASPRCRGIVAISDFARNIFLQQTGGDPALSGKLHRRYPNLVLPEIADVVAGAPVLPFRLVFVGNHFARKGGCVAVKLAEKARQRGLALQLDIVSRLEMGGGIWTDPDDPAAFAPYRALLAQPNVVVHRDLPNNAVLDLLRSAHLSLLPTFGDTFGYSAIESMANHTPVIATRQAALPELIRHGEDGILLDLPVTPLGEWIHLGAPDRGRANFVAAWHAEIDRLAERAFAHIAALANDPRQLAAMRHAARARAAVFSATDATAWWDDFYVRAADGVVASF